MTLFFKDNYGSLLVGDARQELKELPEKSVDSVICSPPYYGLRDYGLEPLIWDGDPNCQHEWRNVISQHQRGAVSGASAKVGNQIRGVQGTDIKQGQFCTKCHAYKGSLGVESLPDCGRPYSVLRKDLTPKQREYVVSELKRLGLI